MIWYINTLYIYMCVCAFIYLHGCDNILYFYRVPSPCLMLNTRDPVVLPDQNRGTQMGPIHHRWFMDDHFPSHVIISSVLIQLIINNHDDNFI
jgi:hypothetical protein